MRTGAWTLQQALSLEAALVVKHALSLARRRGHAQVTPLHVAATLLSSTFSKSTTSLLKLACLRSHPRHPAVFPLQSRTLELCFCVALNKLPTITPPPSPASLSHFHPSLSNALIAALKRAQANQKRGSIEQQQQQQQQHLSFKVELEQLILSILDDPSVSRVLKEAGFSSSSIKGSLEQDTSASPSFPSFLFAADREVTNQSSFCRNEDLRVVLDAMLRKQNRRTNTLVLGDSTFSTEGLVSELMKRVERGEVPNELRYVQFIRFQFSFKKIKSMSRDEVEMKVSDLRRNVGRLTSERGSGGLIIYAGDLRWTVEEITDGEVVVGDCYAYSAADHLIGEVGRLLYEIRSRESDSSVDAKNKVWLMATASYHTYMRCRMRKPSLESQWALQAVAVPSSGLTLSLEAPSGMDSKVAKLAQNPFQNPESSRHFNSKEGQDEHTVCTEFTLNSSNALIPPTSLSFTESENMSGGSSKLPHWLQHHHRPDSHCKDTLLETKRKWHRLHEKIHHSGHEQIHPLPLHQSFVDKNPRNASSSPWWPTSLSYGPSNNLRELCQASSLEPVQKVIDQDSKHMTRLIDGTDRLKEGEAPNRCAFEAGLHPLSESTNQEVRTTLALGSALFSGLATSKDKREGLIADPQELCQCLQENIPWQSEAIPLIIKSLLACRRSERIGKWLVIQGTDQIGKRRLARVIAESICRGNRDSLVHINNRKLEKTPSSCAECLAAALRKDPKVVVLIDSIDRAYPNFINNLAKTIKIGTFDDHFGRKVSLAHGTFILITADPTNLDSPDEEPENVIDLRLHVERTSGGVASSTELKRKPEEELPNKPKKHRTGESGLDLNICAKEEEEEEEERDGEEEMGGRDHHRRRHHLPLELLESMVACFVLEVSPTRPRRMAESFASKLRRSLEAAWGVRDGSSWLSIDEAVVDELTKVSGSFVESLFDEWLTEVFETSLLTVKNGGKLRLHVASEAGRASEFGFRGSVLPSSVLLA